MLTSEKLKRAVNCIRLGAGMGNDWTPEVGLMVGSGLGSYAQYVLADAHSMLYSAIPKFPRPLVEGFNIGKMWWGLIGDRKAVIMQGRIHGYEGYTANDIVFPVRTMIALGAKKIILTNAVGAINVNFSKGDLVVVKDHTGFFDRFNPLIGPNEDTLGTRFPDMNNAYDKELRQHALECFGQLNLRQHTGFYASISGPQYETPGEIQVLRTFGVDMVGMSMVAETIAAAHMGAKVLAISCVTNMAAGISGCSDGWPNEKPKSSHEKVMAASKQSEEKFSNLLSLIINTLPK